MSSQPKRRAPSAPSGQARPSKRAKINTARAILAQSSDKALDQDGELDVGAFVKAREYEMQALGASQEASKKVLSNRAFQQLPKEMRRRTASHNSKKVPKRLRNRADKEVRTPLTWIVAGESSKADERGKLKDERRQHPYHHISSS